MAERQIEEVKALLSSWISAEYSLILETSQPFLWGADFAELARRAEQRCEALGITWSKDFMPKYTWGSLGWIDEYGELIP